MLSPFHSLFWLWCCHCGRCKAENRNLVKPLMIFLKLICWISCRFMLENSAVDEHVRYILSIYPTVILALMGVLTKNYNATAPTRNNTFNGEDKWTIIKHLETGNDDWLCHFSTHTNASFEIFFPCSVGCSMCLACRTGSFGHLEEPQLLCADVSPDVMSPMDFAKTQKKIFKWDKTKEFLYQCSIMFVWEACLNIYIL